MGRRFVHVEDPVINPVSNRPSYADYIRPKAATAPVPADATFQDAATRAAARKRSAASVDNDAYQPGVQSAIAYEYASKRQLSRPQGNASVPRDLLWALTGPGQATDADKPAHTLEGLPPARRNALG
jgi:hypothetical protein